MRLAYIINKDKSIELFQLTADIRPGSGVQLTFPKGVPTIQFPAGPIRSPAIMEEIGNVAIDISDRIHALSIDENNDYTADPTPLEFLEDVDRSKGAQACVDAEGKIRCVRTMREGYTMFVAKGLDLEFETKREAYLDEAGNSTSERETDQDMLDRARGALKRMASKLLLDDDTPEAMQEKVVAWLKGKAKVEKVSEGKKPDYLDRNAVFK